MLIEIPNNWIDFMKKMPKQKEVDIGEPGAHMTRDKNVLKWIRQALYGDVGLSCVPAFIIYVEIEKKAEQLGLITFDPETRTWQGVDYGGD